MSTSPMPVKKRTWFEKPHYSQTRIGSQIKQRLRNSAGQMAFRDQLRGIHSSSDRNFASTE
jgi:hypothetical protein